jgi:hypothetical protein
MAAPHGNEEPTREYRIAWGDPNSDSDRGLHVDTLAAAVVAAAVADDEDEYIALIGLRDFEDGNEIGAVFRQRFDVVSDRLTLDQYEHELRLMYRRFGGKERVAKMLEDFKRRERLKENSQ